MASRQGKAWSNEEICRLMGLIQMKKSIHEIAVEHQRTVGAISSRLRHLAAKFHKEDKLTIDEIQVLTGLSSDEIQHAINNTREKRIQVVSKQTTMVDRKQKIRNTIQSIQTKLTQLTRELDAMT